MNADNYRILPEGTDTSEVVDDPEFTDVTENGEVYTLYRIVRITHEVTGHPEGWTHVANVVRVRDTAIGTALLRVIDRIIDDARTSMVPG